MHPVNPTAVYYSKFVSLADSFVGTFGNQEDFYKGLDSFLGLPNPNVLQALYNEHNSSLDSFELFAPYPRFQISYFPAQEYEIVVSPKLHLDYPSATQDPHDSSLNYSAASGGKRLLKPLDEFLQMKECLNAQLIKEEIIALRLYSGPMFCKYNSILRSFASTRQYQQQSNSSSASPPPLRQTNRYVTTIHCIVSGIIKLSRIMKIPENRMVYRGLGGMLLPEQFWVKDQHGCCGGVEFGMLSTTTEMNVALDYSATDKLDRATVFEIELGQINRGASLTWISQFPCEDEILIAPLSNLEAINEGHVESKVITRLIGGGGGGQQLIQTQLDVLVIPLRLNVNLKSKTIEELIATRKSLHLHALDLLIWETRRELEEKVLLSTSTDDIVSAFEDFRRTETAKPASYFNDNLNFRSSQNQMMDLKIGIMAKEELLVTAKRNLLGFGHEVYVSALLSPDSEETRSDLLLWVKEARNGLMIREKECVGLKQMKQQIQQEISSLREIFEKTCPFLSQLILFDDRLANMVPEGRMTVTKSPRVTRVDSNGFMQRPCTQASRYESVINQNAADPQLSDLLEQIDMLGWFGERTFADECRCQQLRNQTGWLLTNCTDSSSLEDQVAILLTALFELNDLLPAEEMVLLLPSGFEITRDMISAVSLTISTAIQELIALSSGEIFPFIVSEMTCHIGIGEFFRNIPEFSQLRTLERRIELFDRLSLTAFHNDGPQVLTIETMIINTLNSLSAHQFADSTLVTRWQSCIQLLTHVASHFPWCSSFDVISSISDPIAIKLMEENTLVRTGEGIPGEKECKVIKELYGSDRSAISSTYSHSMYLTQSMIDEWKWSKEMYWRLLSSGLVGDEDDQSSQMISREQSVYRVLELCQVGFNLLSSNHPITNCDDVRLGVGGRSLSQLIVDYRTLPQQQLIYQQQLTWIPVFCPFSPSIASFHANQFFDLNILNPVAVSVSKEEEYCLLAGLLWSTKSPLSLQFTHNDQALPQSLSIFDLCDLRTEPRHEQEEEEEEEEEKEQDQNKKGFLNLSEKNLLADHISLLAALLLLPSLHSHSPTLDSIESIILRNKSFLGTVKISAMLSLLRRFPNLRRLNLSQSPGFVPEEFRELLKHLLEDRMPLLTDVELSSSSIDYCNELFYNNNIHSLTLTDLVIEDTAGFGLNPQSCPREVAGKLRSLALTRTSFPNCEVFDYFIQSLVAPSSATLTSLTLSACHDSDQFPWPILCFSELNLPNLTSLNLSENSLDDKAIHILCSMLSTRCQSLQELDLSSNKISCRGAKDLSEMIQSYDRIFRNLSLAMNSIEDQGVGDLAENCLHLLISFDISANQFQDLGACAMATSLAKIDSTERSCHLKSLNISYNKISTVGLSVLREAVFHCVTLRELIAKNDATNSATQSHFSEDCDWFQFILEMSSCPHLRVLKLASVNLNAPSLPTAAATGVDSVATEDHLQLSQIPQHGLIALLGSSLATIQLNNVRWEFPLTSPPKIIVSPFLRRLRLAEAHLGSVGTIMLLTALMSNDFTTRLTHLELPFNMMGDLGAQSMVSFLRSPSAMQLQHLDLSLNNLRDDEMIQQISQAAEGVRTLTHFFLSHNRFGNVGAGHLADLIKRSVSLEFLEVNGCDFNLHGVVSLRAASKFKSIKTPFTLELKNHK